MPIAWTLASGNTEQDIEEAKDFLHQKRHNIFKLKIGKGDPRKNVEHVRKLKKQLEIKRELRVDVNQAWDEDTAHYCIEALEDGGVSIDRATTPNWNHEGMSRLTARFKVPIMADEAANSQFKIVFQISKHRAGNCHCIETM